MISDVYPPLVGGQEREVQLLSEGLAGTKDCSVAVCTLMQDSLPKYEEINLVKVYRLDGFFQRMPFLFKDRNRRFHPPISDWMITRKIEKIILREKPSIVHAHNWMLYSLLPLRKKIDFALCVTFHDFGFICPRRWSSAHVTGICENPLTRDCLACGRQVYGLPKSFFVYSALQANKDFSCDTIVFTNPNIVKKMHHLKQRKIYLEHPVDVQKYRPLEVDKYKYRLLVWAKLDRMKGIDVVFDVAKEMSDYQFDIPFIGDDREYYKKMKPSNVNLVQKIEPNEVPRTINRYPLVLGQFHVGVFGHAELEAMSCGKPVVSYWNREYDTFYESPCPILSAKNPKEAVNLIRSNINNDKLGHLSRQWILKNHAVPYVVKKLCSIYEKTISCHALQAKPLPRRIDSMVTVMG